MLGVAIADSLPRLQAQAESRMSETCRVDRVLSTTSDDLGNTVPVLADPPVYVGMTRIKSFRSYEQTPEVGVGTLVQQRYDLHFPAVERVPVLVAAGVVQSSGDLRVGDFATITTPGKRERVFRLAAEHDVTDQTAQRLLVDEQTGGIGA